jgi:serine/threonine protein kinase/Tfp pilus assembly protein PilF
MEAFTQFGKYQILDRIAFGGMAELYRARIQGDQGFQKLVAVKKMHAHFSTEPEAVEAFIKEAKLAAFLQHPNIVQIYDFGCMEDAYFIVMEYLQGKDLRTLTTALDAQQRPLGLENSLAVAASICSGLEYAHRLTDMAGHPLHIVHRDISPQNIFVTYAGQVQILDFGIAKVTDRDGTTEAGVLKGKVAYMSPEQAQGKIIDHRSDIFSVGVILYELLTGQRLYQGNNMEILRRAQTGEFLRPEECLPDLIPELSHVFQGLLAVHPEDRFPDCAVALAAIEECLGDLSSRSIERHLGDLVSDLFAAEKMTEEATLQDLLTDGVTMDTPGTSVDRLDHDPALTENTALQSPAPMSGTPPRKSGRRWLHLALIGLLVGASLLMWVRWHIPGKGGVQSLEAFQARNFTETTPSVDAEQNQASPEAELHAQTAMSPLERQARSLMASDPQQAGNLWRQVIERAPDNLPAVFNLGLVHLELEDYPQAIAAFERVLDLDPEMVDAHFNLGFAYAKMGRYDDATVQYAQVVDQAPAYLDEVLFNLAIVQDFQGDRQAAARSLHGAIRYNPHNVRAISYLARMEGRFSSPP